MAQHQLPQTYVAIALLIWIICLQVVGAAFRPASFVDSRRKEVHNSRQSTWMKSANNGAYPFNLKAQASGDYSTIVGVGTKFSADRMDLSGGSLLVEGNLTLKKGITGVCREVHVQGRLQGDVSGVEIVRIGGLHIGNIKCAQLIVESKGEVRGDVDTNLLILKPGGRIKGAVRCEKISAEEPYVPKTETIEKVVAPFKHTGPSSSWGASSTLDDATCSSVHGGQERVGYDGQQANGQRQPAIPSDEVYVAKVGDTSLKLKSIENANGLNGARQPIADSFGNPLRTISEERLNGAHPICSMTVGQLSDDINGNPTDELDIPLTTTNPDVERNGANGARRRAGSMTTGTRAEEFEKPTDSFDNTLTASNALEDRNGDARRPGVVMAKELAAEKFENPTLTISPTSENTNGARGAHCPGDSTSTGTAAEHFENPTDSFGNPLTVSPGLESGNSANDARRPGVIVATETAAEKFENPTLRMSPALESRNGANGAHCPGDSMSTETVPEQFENPTDSFVNPLTITPALESRNVANGAHCPGDSMSTETVAEQFENPTDSFGNPLTITPTLRVESRNGANGARRPGGSIAGTAAEKFEGPTDSFGNPLTISPLTERRDSANSARRPIRKATSADDSGNPLPADGFGKLVSRDLNGVNVAHQPSKSTEDLTDSVSSNPTTEERVPTPRNDGMQTDSFGNPLCRSNSEADVNAFRRNQEALAQTRLLLDAYCDNRANNVGPTTKNHLNGDDAVPDFLRKGRGATK